MSKIIGKWMCATLFVALLSNTQAQIFSGGVVAGVSTGAVRIEDIPSGFAGTIQGTNINGFEGGLYAKLYLAPFYIKPMALYDFRSGTVTYQSANVSQQNSFFVSRAQVPVLLGLHLLGPLSIEGGPVYNYIINSTNSFNEHNVQLQKDGLGYRVGLAAELGFLMLYASYGGSANMKKDMNSATFREPSKLVFGLGLKLGRMQSSRKKS
jgi:hypothetical protein